MGTAARAGDGELAARAGDGELAAASMLERYAEKLGGPANAEESLRAAAGRSPGAIGPRLVLARRLLGQERIGEAMPLLLGLQAQGVAEAAYCLGVSAIRRNDLSEALRWMERAEALNPSHAQTKEQLEHLRRALA